MIFHRLTSTAARALTGRTVMRLVRKGQDLVPAKPTFAFIKRHKAMAARFVVCFVIGFTLTGVAVFVL